ncbi:MAG TPA: tetratricopeptide repeat protein [Burkholderiales bacterium]|nr:tetratricopeptide repeat protein [Burkholderiales bacterium]
MAMLKNFLKQLWMSRSFARKQDPIDAKTLAVWLETGLAAHRAGDLSGAEKQYRQILEHDPDHPEALFHLGTLAGAAGRFDAACELYQQALAVRPDWFELRFCLGNALRSLGRFESAIGAMETASWLKPDSVGARVNLAMLFWESGRIREAEGIFRGLAEGNSDDARDARDNLLMMLSYREDLTPQQCYAEHLRWAAHYADPLTAAADPPTRPIDSERPLNIGYVSPDFRLHPVAIFLLPLLAHHDRERYRIHCYATRRFEDQTTVRLRAQVQEWRDITALSDDEAAKLIRDDGIDVLVDLAGHTGWNRLTLFARRPAPVQVGWLGYLNTTGMRAMDARLTDAVATPPGLDAFHSERVVRLPYSQWCFQPIVEAPEVAPPPSRRDGRITFGAFHNLAKLGPGVIRQWSFLLKQIPHSRLLVMAKGLADGGHDLLDRFAAEGVAADRVALRNAVPYRDYLATYREVDIALDAFPYSGGTTTCEALWMGVPVVTWACPAMPGRSAASLLSAAGLPELVADSPEAYLSIARELADDPSRLENLRATLRQRMLNSPLMDAQRFAGDVEEAFRGLWRAWCAGR